MTTVSNTSSIANLAQVGHLGLVQKLYGNVLIPTAVREELLDERAGEVIIAAVRAATWLQVLEVKNRDRIGELRARINVGEAEAIALAIEVRATRLLIDERLGREVAAGAGLKVTGVLGMLLRAKREKRIDRVAPIVDALTQQANFRVSDRLVAEVLSAAGE